MSKNNHGLRGVEPTNSTDSGIYSGVNQNFSLLNFFARLLFRRSDPAPINVIRTTPNPQELSHQNEIFSNIFSAPEEEKKEYNYIFTDKEIAQKASEFEARAIKRHNNGTLEISELRDEIIQGDKDHDNIISLNSSSLPQDTKYAVLDVAELIKIRNPDLYSDDNLSIDSEGKLFLLYKENPDHSISEVSSVLLQDGKSNIVMVDGVEISPLNFTVPANNSTNSTTSNPTSMPSSAPSNDHNDLVGYIVGGFILSGICCILYRDQKFSKRNRVADYQPTSHPTNIVKQKPHPTNRGQQISL